MLQITSSRCKCDTPFGYVIYLYDLQEFITNEMLHLYSNAFLRSRFQLWEWLRKLRFYLFKAEIIKNEDILSFSAEYKTETMCTVSVGQRNLILEDTAVLHDRLGLDFAASQNGAEGTALSHLNLTRLTRADTTDE